MAAVTVLPTLLAVREMLELPLVMMGVVVLVLLTVSARTDSLSHNAVDAVENNRLC
jgi:hypothetical protein